MSVPHYPVQLGLTQLCPSAASDYGMRLPILRSTPEDQVLYQTERYSEDTFGYEVPIRDEGDYILVLKFAEVYFAQSQQKVCPTPSPSPWVLLADHWRY